MFLQFLDESLESLEPTEACIYVQHWWFVKKQSHSECISFVGRKVNIKRTLPPPRKKNEQRSAAWSLQMDYWPHCLKKKIPLYTFGCHLCKLPVVSNSSSSQFVSLCVRACMCAIKDIPSKQERTQRFFFSFRKRWIGWWKSPNSSKVRSTIENTIVTYMITTVISTRYL